MDTAPITAQAVHMQRVLAAVTAIGLLLTVGGALALLASAASELLADPSLSLEDADRRRSRRPWIDRRDRHGSGPGPGMRGQRPSSRGTGRVRAGRLLVGDRA